MKKIILIISLFVWANHTQAQENFVKASDTLTQKIVAPDEVYNNFYTLDQNGRAYLYGADTISKTEFFEIDGFYSQKFQKLNVLEYHKNKKIDLVVYEEAVSKKHIAWFFIIITFAYYLISSFFSRIYAPAVWPALGAFATGVLIFVVAAAIGIARTEEEPGFAEVLVFTAVAVSGVVILLFRNNFYRAWVITSIIAMIIYWYLFTPLFFVFSIAGIISGYILATLVKKLS